MIVGRVVRIDDLPTSKDGSVPKMRSTSFRHQMNTCPNTKNLRTDLKPLLVVQPEGTSFTVVENFKAAHLVSWQKSRFRIDFSGRESLVSYDVSILTAHEIRS